MEHCIGGGVHRIGRLTNLAVPAVLALACAAEPGRKPVTLFGARAPGRWDSDGTWTVAPRDGGIGFLKDKTAVHNAMCWTKLTAPLRRGQTLEITYRMEVPRKHVDLFLGRNCARRNHGEPLPEFAEVLSLGGLESTGWQTRKLTITSPEEIDTLGFLSWGWPVDRGTWMTVARIRAHAAPDASEWFVWRVPAHENDKSVPERHPLQDFFPFGVYLPVEFGAACAKAEGLKDRWEWYDVALADIKARGMNFVCAVNIDVGELDKFAQLHAKHGLRLNPQVCQFDVKSMGAQALKPFVRTVAKYRGNPVIAGWAVGEEFRPDKAMLVDLPHEIVHAVDPTNTLVTVHNNTGAFRVVGRNCDVRIAIRDIYPFYGDVRNGPTTFEASMNYYEDDLNKNQCLLPKGASLWVIAQAYDSFYDVHGNGVKIELARQPTPAEVKLQTWAALAIGAQGVAFYLYPSNVPDKPGERALQRSLRTYDGKPTPQLEAVTELARKLTPLGSVITRWQRTRLPAATDHRALRAYLFRGGNGVPYLVAYNRGVESPASGRVRIPFTCPTVADLVSGETLEVAHHGQATVFPLALQPGEGTILRLSGVMPEPAAQLDTVDEPHVSGRPRPDLPLTALPDGRSLFSYKANLQKTRGVPDGDSLPGSVAFHDWQDYGRIYMNGVYGRQLNYSFSMPGEVTKLTASGLFANHADNVQRSYRILYSLDGKAFETLGQTTMGGSGGTVVSGTASLPKQTRKVWVSYALPARNHAVVLKELSVELTVAAAGAVAR